MKFNGTIQLYPLARILVFLIIGIIIGNYFYKSFSFFYIYITLFSSLLFSLIFINKKEVSNALVFITTILFGILIVANKQKSCISHIDSGWYTYEAIIASKPKISNNKLHCNMYITKIKDLKSPHKAYLVKANIETPIENFNNYHPGDGFIISSYIYNFRKPKKGKNKKHRLEKQDFNFTTNIRNLNHEKTTISIKNLSRIQKSKIKFLKLRESLSAHLLNKNLSHKSQKILAAMVLGDKSKLNSKDYDSFSKLGISHILALSGLHLSILYGVLLYFFPRKKFKVLSNTLQLLLIWLYVFMVGLPESAIRSALMISLYILFSIVNRKGLSLNVLSLAGIIMLCFNPFCLWHISFQLSFLAVLGIIIFTPYLLNLAHKIPIVSTYKPIFYLWNITAVSFAAQMGTFPLAMYYFKIFPIVFFISNIVIIPLVTLIISISFLYFIPISFLSTPIAIILNTLLHIMFKFVEYTSKIPHIAVTDIDINLTQVILIYLLIILISIIIYRTNHKWSILKHF